jgi:hypothetical protein
MKTPTWGTVIGVLMIMFGGCSVLSNVQLINLPDKLEEKKVEIHHNMDESKTEESDSVDVEANDSLITESGPSGKEEKLEEAEKALELSEFSKTWMVRFGYIGIIVALIYMTSGFFLMKPKRFSIQLAYGALILSIAYCATQTVVLTSAGSSAGMIALITGASKIVSIIIDIILLSVVFASDKEAYSR